MKTIYKHHVLYADTDAMGVVYYGNYMRIYEAARNEFLQKINLSFSELGKMGYICPVVNVNVRYLKPAMFDEDIYVHSYISAVSAAKLQFTQYIKDSEDRVINKMTLEMAFVDAQTKRATRCPEAFYQYVSVEE